MSQVVIAFKADKILLGLNGPATLVFMGFIGSIGAEVVMDVEDCQSSYAW